MNIARRIPPPNWLQQKPIRFRWRKSIRKMSRFQDNTIWPVFERLRREDPVHFTPESEFGPYWSITKWEDIVAVDTNFQDFSSTGGIALSTLEAREQLRKELGDATRNHARRRAARRSIVHPRWTSRFMGLSANL